MKRLRRHGRISSTLALSLAAGVVSVSALHSQGAVDPNVAPRAAALERGGDWTGATELLGRYLATAPGDGRAWFQFGRMYLVAAQQWHLEGHAGDPDGSLYLDLAAIAFENAINLKVDSGRIYRGAVEMERGLIRLEQRGWRALRDAPPRRDPLAVPGFVVELGTNLLNSCPANGVLIPGNQLEALSAWLAAVELGQRIDIFPILPGRFEYDELYRRQAAFSLGFPAAMPLVEGLTVTGARRTLCLTPFADTTVVAEAGPWVATRLTLVAGPDTTTTPDVLSISQLVYSQDHRPSTWTRAVADIYLQAARRNIRLCGGLLAYLNDPARPACGR